MLTSLSHNTIGSSYYEDSAIHLSSTSDHVLDIVSVARAVNVCIVSLCSLILDVSSRDGDSSLSLFGSFVDLIESNCSTTLSDSQNGCDSSGKGCLAVVNVADCADVAVRFCSVKMSFSHFSIPP